MNWPMFWEAVVLLWALMFEVWAVTGMGLTWETAGLGFIWLVLSSAFLQKNYKGRNGR